MSNHIRYNKNEEQVMSTWEELDNYLSQLLSEIGGTYYILTDTSKGQLSPNSRYREEIIDRFEESYQTLKSMFGDNFLKRGKAKRLLQPEGKNRFIAEPLLTAYLLII